MSLLSRIDADFKTALKAKNQIVLDVLRMLKTAITTTEKNLRRPLEEAEVLEVLAKQAKQRRESIEQFSGAGRNDLADKEKAELVILEGYLPEPLSAEELEAAVDKVVTETGAASMKDMGKVMQAIMAEYKGRVDGGALSALVKARLSS